MIPVRIYLENFMNHRLSDIDCSTFNSALIVAKNKDNERQSNGIGKTTIFSAIEYALFGEVPTSTLDKVIRDGCDKCIVMFDFKTNDGTFRILRGRSSKGRSELKLYELIGDKWEAITQRGMPETEKKIAELIKLSHKAFSHSIKFAQSDLAGLSSAADPEKRKAILKEPLQLSEYTKLERIATEKAKPVRKEIEKTETSIQMLGDPDSDIKAAESELQVCESEIQSKNGHIDRLVTSAAEKHKEVDDIKKTLNSTDSEVHEKIAQLNKRSKDLKTIITKANERVQDSDKSINDDKLKIVEIRNLLTEIASKEQECEDKKLRSGTLVISEIEKVSADELYENKLLAKLEVEYDQANKNVPNGNICPHCFQPITAEHRKRCQEEMSKVLAEKAEQIKTTSANLIKCSNKKKRLQSEHQEINERDRLVISLSQRKEKAQAEIDIRTKHNKEAEIRLSEAVNEMQTAQSEYDELFNRLEGLKESAKNSSVADVNNKIFALDNDIKVFERSLKNVRAELSNMQNRKGAAQEKLKKANENSVKISDLKKELVVLKNKLKIHQLVINTFSPDGIPTFIIHTILDELQLESNAWLLKLRPELRVEFNKDVDMFFFVDNMPRDYDQLSIGQHVYLALAMKLSLSRIIQKKLGIDVKFLLLDEVDSALDLEGVDVYSSVIHKLESEFKVFVITHNKDLREKFSNVILVEGGNDGATARVVNNWQ
jgi:DNA repair exonuclease SbcCD ATPase subunit